MEKKQFFICLSGRTIDGFDPDQVIRSLAHLMHINEKQARQLLNEQPVRLKQTFDREHILPIHKKLMQLGIECRIKLVDVHPQNETKVKNAISARKNLLPTAVSSSKDLSPATENDKGSNSFNAHYFFKNLNNFIDKQSLPIAIVCFLLLTIQSYAVYIMSNYLDPKVLFMILLPLLLIWGLLKDFRVGWGLSIVYLGYNFFDALGYYRALQGTPPLMAVSVLILVTLALMVLLMPSVLHRLKFSWIDQGLSKLPRPLRDALWLPICIIILLSLAVDESKNKTFTFMAGQIVSMGLVEMSGAVVDYLYQGQGLGREGWPVGKVLPLLNKKIVASAVFVENNTLNIRYVDNEYLHNASIQMIFTSEGSLIKCRTDSIPGRLIAPNFLGFPCDASSSTMR
ncbi:MAG: hypothetical protein Q9M15_08645 [Mariprofundaceae bacterium]|nr:hypothetical protein [Mariprofundaceae bacterium]